MKCNTVLKYTFLIVLILHSSDAIAQKYLSEFIDSTIKREIFSINDWAIGLNTDTAGEIPIMDSLGNEIIDLESNCTLLILKIQNIFYLQKFTESYIFDRVSFHASKLKILPKNITVNYTVDSLYHAKNENVLPYIYKDNINNAYNYQQPADHSRRYKMYFKTKNLDIMAFFDEDCIVEKLRFLKPSQKNLNFSYNSKTFILRAFFKLKQLFKEHKEILTFN